MLARRAYTMIDFNYKPKLTKSDFGWHERGRIPHLDGEEFTQFVTFRLCDSLPSEALDAWRSEHTEEDKFRKRIEEYLDAGHGECWLRDPRVAQIVEEALFFHHGRKYDLRAWVIMPNHGHVMLTLRKGIHLPTVENNPVKAGLCKKPEDWRWSSAFYREHT